MVIFLAILSSLGKYILNFVYLVAHSGPGVRYWGVEEQMIPGQHLTSASLVQCLSFYFVVFYKELELEFFCGN